MTVLVASAAVAGAPPVSVVVIGAVPSVIWSTMGSGLVVVVGVATGARIGQAVAVPAIGPASDVTARTPDEVDVVLLDVAPGDRAGEHVVRGHGCPFDLAGHVVAERLHACLE